MSVPRGTPPPKRWEPRLSVRISPDLKTEVRRTVHDLQLRGLRTTESELVELLVEEGVGCPLDELDDRLRRWRSQESQT